MRAALVVRSHFVTSRDGRRTTPARDTPQVRSAQSHRTYDADFRAAAVWIAIEPGARISAVAAELGVSPSTLRRWVRASEQAALVAPPPSSKGHDEPDDLVAREGAAEPDGLAAREGTSDADGPAPDAAAAPTAVAAPSVGASEPPPATPATPATPVTPTTSTQPLPATPPGDEIWPGLSGLVPAYRLPIVLAALALAVAVSTVIPDEYAWRPAANALHVISLVLALGPVLFLDWHGLLWLTGRRGIGESARLAAAASPLIWTGLAGLIVSGALLHPHLTPLTVTKLVLVLAVGWNGAALSVLRKRLARLPPGTTPRSLPRRDWGLMLTVTALSQVGWWGASIIGFVNVRR